MGEPIREVRVARYSDPPSEAREGQSYRRTETVLAPLRVHFPESGSPHRLRDSLRARVHPDRHDRRRIPGRCAAGPYRRCGNSLSVRDRKPLLQPPDRSERCGMDLFGRTALAE